MRGKQVAILESRLGAQVADLVTKHGGIPFHAPALAELPDLDPAQIRHMVESLAGEPAKLVIFQTGVGTKALFNALDSLSLSEEFLSFLKGAVVAARGPKPTGALRARGVRIDRSAGDPFTTKELLEAISDVDVKGRVIVQRHGALNTELDRALEARGATVTEIPTYRWSLPSDTAPLKALIARLEKGEMHAAVFTNAEQVRNLFLVSEDKRSLQKALNNTLVASIGPVASAALREAGVNIGVEASPPKLGALLSSLEAALS
jgi:uroporphyrinogen-III synthase